MESIAKYKSLYRNLLLLAVPMALQNLISFGVGFADNLMVSSLGDLALSGVFLSNQVQNILHMLTMGVGSAMVVLATQYIGKNDKENAKTIIAIVMKFCLFLGLLCTLAVSLFPSQILHLFTDDEAVVQEGMKYIGIVCFSYIFFCANSVFLSSMRCVQNTRVGLYTSLIGFSLNVMLNWILIFGKLGLPALGVRGAAIATLIARIVEMLFSFSYVHFVDQQLALKFKDYLRNSYLLIRDFFRYGFPIILGDVIWGIAGAVQVAILGRLGAEVLAANTIAGNLGNIFGVVVYAIAGSTGIIIGRMVGAGEYDKIKEYTRPLQIIFICFGLLTGLATFLLRGTLLSIGFSGISPQAHTYAMQFLTVLSISIVGTAYQMSVLTGIVRAGGATDFVLKNDLFWVWVVVIPSALLSAFVFHAPPWVVFACIKSDQILKCSVAVIKLHRFDWMKKLTRENL